MFFWCRVEENTNEVTMENAVGGIEEENIDRNLYYRLAEIFPDACPNYIKQLCLGKTCSPKVVDHLVNAILSGKFLFLN